ncbi:MAG: response regulator [Alphaproteobacteria bacterium]|nr:response regulator [Alphaproteobacteria bacterium]
MVSPSFRRIALPAAALALTVALAALVWWGMSYWVRSEERSASSLALARANLGAEALEQQIGRTLDLVEQLHDLIIARQRMIEAGNQSGQLAIEQQIHSLARRRESMVIQVSIASPDGVVRWMSLPTPTAAPVFVGDADHFRLPRAGVAELFVSERVPSRFGGQPAVAMSRTLRDSAGEIIGVPMVTLSAEALSRAMADVNLGGAGIGLLMRRDGTLLATTRATGGEERLSPSHPVLGAIRLNRGGELDITNPEDGRPALIGFRALRGAPLVVVAALDRERELAAVNGLRRAAILAALVITLLSASLVVLLLLVLERRRARAALDAAEAQRRATVETLAESQRMEALGRLAGGVAHDINNVLQAVLGGAKLIGKRSQDPGIHKLAQLVSEAAERGGGVTRRLLAFARRDSLRAEPLPVDGLLEGVREVLTHSLGPSIRVNIAVARGVPPLLADRSQVETVLVNLAINARDAMMPQGGTLELGGAAEIIPDNNDIGLEAGRYVRLWASDTGRGMDAQTLRRATEPFFTTKDKGQGTGLGLAMAQGFAEQSGGAMRIASVQGQGTRVTLWLPQAPAASSVLQPADARPVTLRRLRVLLVDDEPEVLSVTGQGLKDRGHGVHTAAGGLEALGALETGLAPDLLVTDLSMPGLDGLALIERARRLRPGLPAILLTGFVAEAQDNLEQAAESGPIAVLRKPITPEALHARMQRLMTDKLAG